VLSKPDQQGRGDQTLTIRPPHGRHHLKLGKHQ
jgi:hypothetical protein